MPSPETQYFLDSALEHYHIAGDTHHYLMEIATGQDDLLAGLPPRAQEGEPYMAYLQRCSLLLEHEHLAWRREGGRSREGAVAALSSAAGMARECADMYANTLVEHGCQRLDRRAWSILDEHYQAGTAMAVARRGVCRAAQDLQGWGPVEFSNQRSVDQAMWQHRMDVAALGLEASDSSNPEDEARTLKQARQRIREQTQAQRRVIKRSARLLTRLLGHDTTRMFIGGNAIRIEGRHAVYEMRRTGRLGNAHSGFDGLHVYDKTDPSILLCKVCIYTEGVPLLDHVASMVLHIQGGMEEEILRQGNPRQIHELAYAQDWLRPYLPPPRATRTLTGLGVVQVDGMDLEFHHVPQTAELGSLRQRLRPMIARSMYRHVIGNHGPLVRMAAPDFGRIGPWRLEMMVRALVAEDQDIHGHNTVVAQTADMHDPCPGIMGP